VKALLESGQKVVAGKIGLIIVHCACCLYERLWLYLQTCLYNAVMPARFCLGNNPFTLGCGIRAGVEDMDAAQATLAFAKKYELLSKKALENLQLRQTEAGDATGLPR